MEKKYIILSVSGVIIAGGIGVYLYNKSKAVTVAPVINPSAPTQNTPSQQVAAAVNTATQIVSTANALTNESFPLKVGMIGPNVKAMQVALKTKFNELNVSNDGVYGPKTLLALIHQKYASALDSKVTQEEFDAILAGTKK
jgi:hypothetical protein